MAKYLFIYHGGSTPNSPEEGQKQMEAWAKWLESLGDAVIDGGHPIGASTTVLSDNTTIDNGGSNPTTGYGLFEAVTLEDAISMAKNCPILAAGGSIELGETFNP